MIRNKPEGHGRVALIGFAKDFGDGPSAPLLSTKDRDGSVILLNDDIYTLRHASQHGTKIARYLGCAHGYGCHCFHYGSNS
ncbi:MAG: hypothetical protein NTV52_07200 [Acidobacteria bacterium]|nr:hypothetical protein [Acidobacteriota bacterium]